MMVAVSSKDGQNESIVYWPLVGRLLFALCVVLAVLAALGVEPIAQHVGPFSMTGPFLFPAYLNIWAAVGLVATMIFACACTVSARNTRIGVAWALCMVASCFLLLATIDQARIARNADWARLQQTHAGG